MPKLRYLSNVVTLKLDREKCTGCGMCTDVCPHGVLVIEDSKAVIVDRDACMECGACAGNCPFEVVSVDAGVGCALAILRGALSGTAPSCDCSSGPSDSGPACCGD
ncbi:MAG: mercury methylation ferredoxin HgcB [Planctomycetia bacterium]|nr:mercury methylation ferredoxin HgcB [Planctomycetia bacterium]